MLITQTPLRMSFTGGGTDLQAFYQKEDGIVCSITMDKYIYVLVKERFDKKLVINWSKKETVDSVDEIQHELIREALRKTGISRGIEVITTADIPSEGSGLGSSSALTVGLLHAFYLYQGKLVSAQQLAQEAVEIEVDILKKPIGKQDHYAAAYGGFKEYTFRSDGRVDVAPIEVERSVLKQLDSHLMLFYTNRTRSANTILKEQKQNTADRFSFLKEIRDQGAELKQSLQQGNYANVGSILNHQWQLKKRLASQISDPEIDAMYESALVAGASGGKILGAGGGGFLLVYCRPENRDKLRSALSQYPEMPFQFEMRGSRSVFNIQRDIWKI